jgi:hypothetical protein
MEREQSNMGQIAIQKVDPDAILVKSIHIGHPFRAVCVILGCSPPGLDHCYLVDPVTIIKSAPEPESVPLNNPSYRRKEGAARAKGGEKLHA